MVDMESGQRHNESPTANRYSRKFITPGYHCKHLLRHFVLFCIISCHRFQKINNFCGLFTSTAKFRDTVPWSFSPPLTLIVPISPATSHDALYAGIDSFAYPASLPFKQLAGKQELLAVSPLLRKNAQSGYSAGSRNEIAGLISTTAEASEAYCVIRSYPEGLFS